MPEYRLIPLLKDEKTASIVIENLEILGHPDLQKVKNATGPLGPTYFCDMEGEYFELLSKAYLRYRKMKK